MKGARRMSKEIESVIKRLEQARKTIERDGLLTWEGMDAILEFIIIRAKQMTDKEDEE